MKQNRDFYTTRQYLGDYNLTYNVHQMPLYNTIASNHQHPGNYRKRLYLHIDMDCFYAQIEQQCYNLYGIPVIIGGWRKENGIARGIVATSSYEARRLGIKTGMSAYEAVQICPYIVPLQVHYEKYKAISRDINTILNSFVDEIEAYSMDEYFFDVSFLLKRDRGEILDFGTRLKNEIYRKTKLTSSVGIAYSKTYSKLASNLRKPNGLTVILNTKEAAQLLYPLSLNEVWGIGRIRFKKLKNEGVETISDAIKRGPEIFQKIFGFYFGKMLFEAACGKDCAKVMNRTDHVPREITYMHTFSNWTIEMVRLRGEITKAVQQLCYRMRGSDRKAEKYGGYIRIQDITWKGISFIFATKGLTNLNNYVLQACLEVAEPLLTQFIQEGHKIRGIGLHTIEMNTNNQLELFFREDEKLARMYFAMDKINNRFGLDTIIQASMNYAVEGKTHFLERNT